LNTLSSKLSLLLAWAFFEVVHGAAVNISNIQVSSLPGTQDSATAGSSSSDPYLDDVFIDSFDVMTTTGVNTFSRTGGNIQLGSTVRVRSGAGFVNAEFGDLDNGADGNANPFVKAGLIAEGVAVPSSLSESTDPAIQNAAISAAINSFSINEGIDGEGPAYTLDYFFEVSVTDNSPVADNSPEFIFFERGRNSGIIVEAIIGGSLDSPILAGTAFTLGVSDFGATDIFTDTNEIGSAQELGAVGLDLTDLNVGTAAVLGLRITSLENTGADISGIFVVAENPEMQFADNPIPEPSPILLWALATLSFIRRRRSLSP